MLILVKTQLLFDNQFTLRKYMGITEWVTVDKLRFLSVLDLLILSQHIMIGLRRVQLLCINQIWEFLFCLVIHSRPDLSYSLVVHSHFYCNSGPVHVELIKHVLRYLSGKLKLGLTFEREPDTPDDVIEYKDSDFAGSKTDQKSTWANVFKLAGAGISHSSKQ